MQFITATPRRLHRAARRIAYPRAHRARSLAFSQDPARLRRGPRRGPLPASQAGTSCCAEGRRRKDRFGIAKGEEDSTAAAACQGIIGRLLHRPSSAGAAISKRVRIYALGSSFPSSCRTQPLRGPSDFEVMRCCRAPVPRVVSSGDVPTYLDDVVQRAFAKDAISDSLPD